MALSFEDILAEVRRQEQENAGSIGAGPRQGLGAPFSGVGDLLKGIADMNLERQRRGLVEKAKKIAEENRNYETKLQDLTLQKKKAQLEEDKSKVDEAKKAASLNRIDQAYGKQKLLNDDSDVNKITPEDYESAGVLYNPLTKKPLTLKDKIPQIDKLEKELQNPKNPYHRHYPLIEADLEKIYTSKRLDDFVKTWNPVLRQEERADDAINRTIYGKGSKDPMAALGQINGQVIATMKAFAAVDNNPNLKTEEDRHKQKDLILNGFKLGPVAKAREIFKKVGADDQLQQLEDMESKLDDLIAVPQNKESPGLWGTLFGGISKLFSDTSSQDTAQKTAAMTAHPSNASKEKTGGTPISPAAPGMEREVAGRGRVRLKQGMTYDSYKNRAIDRAKGLGKQGLSKNQIRKTIQEEYPDLR